MEETYRIKSVSISNEPSEVHHVIVYIGDNGTIVDFFFDENNGYRLRHALYKKMHSLGPTLFQLHWDDDVVWQSETLPAITRDESTS